MARRSQMLDRIQSGQTAVMEGGALIGLDQMTLWHVSD
jgi:hypothetical protein